MKKEEIISKLQDLYSHDDFIFNDPLLKINESNNITFISVNQKLSESQKIELVQMVNDWYVRKKMDDDLSNRLVIKNLEEKLKLLL